jgi:hypothetical protein
MKPGDEYHIIRWCKRCDRHYSKCKCKNPEWTTNDQTDKDEKG